MIKYVCFILSLFNWNWYKKRKDFFIFFLECFFINKSRCIIKLEKKFSFVNNLCRSCKLLNKKVNNEYNNYNSCIIYIKKFIRLNMNEII